MQDFVLLKPSDKVIYHEVHLELESGQCLTLLDTLLMMIANLQQQLLLITFCNILGGDLARFLKRK